jgi:hypothetical protein
VDAATGVQRLELRGVIEIAGHSVKRTQLFAAADDS